MRQWRSDQPPSLAVHPLASGLMPLSFLFYFVELSPASPYHPVLTLDLLFTCVPMCLRCYDVMTACYSCFDSNQIVHL